MFRTILLSVLISWISYSEGVCTNTLPLTSGTWKTSNRGTWTVNSGQTQISGFQVTTNTAAGPFTVTVSCEDDTTDTDGYILLKSTTTRNLFGGPKYIYACVKFEQQTSSNSDAYYYYMSAVETTLSTGSYERIILLPSSVTTFSFDTLCNDKSTTPDRTHVAIKHGTESAAAVTCPTSILGTFSYSDTSCTSTFADVCTVRSEFNLNYTVCAEEQMFSAGGQFYCVHGGSNDGNDYVTLYNRDSSVDSSTYYQFVCMVYSTADTIVTASINPKECFSSSRQTTTSTVHTQGLTRTFTNYADSDCYVTSSSSTNLTWLYVLIAIILLLIFFAIIVAIWYFKCRKKKENKLIDEESPHVSDVEEEEKKEEDPKPIKKKQREPSPEPPPKEEEDTKSIDSGIQQDKKEEVKKEEKKVEIVDIEEKKEKKEEPKKEEEVEEPSESEAESVETEESSRVTTPEDPEEVERKIKQIGMKKTTNFQPTGELNTVLVSRKQQEKNQINAEKGKWKKMKNKFRGKTKKIKDAGQDKNKEHEREKSAKRISSPRKEKELTNERAVTPFMDEYKYKKKMEDKLEEKHTWGKGPDYSDRFKDSDDEEFDEILREIEQEEKDRKNDKTKVHYADENKKEGRKRRKSTSQDKVKISKAEKERRKLKMENEAKDSGVDSPDPKKESMDIYDIDTSELPQGYTRDSEGQIIRSYDGKVMTKDEMTSIFQLAKLGQLFHVPRLKRNASGRPTGEFLEDAFGPPIEKDDDGEEEIITDDPFIDDYSKPKRQKSAITNRTLSRRDQRDHKTVAFDINDNKSDIVTENEQDDLYRKEDLTSKDRELLRSRLFKGKRKPSSRGALDDRPRELSDLVRVIPQGSAKKYAVNGRGPERIRSENYDPEQQQRYREGLATDKRILDKSPAVKRRDPGQPTEAFVNQDTDDIRISVGSPEHRQQGINIGSDDEFFLVSSVADQQEKLFSQVRRPGQTTVRPLPHTNDWFCPKHDMRHALPWSLINQYQIRESSILDANSVAKKHTAPKSAENTKKKIDDRRLKELLEELYKDKKYFDHVIDSTEPNIEPIIDERDLATHGREFLLERAEYWDDRGVAMTRPPTTALGYRLSRMNTQIPDNGRQSTMSAISSISPTPNIPDTHRSSGSSSVQNNSHKRKGPLPKAFLKREHTIS